MTRKEAIEKLTQKLWAMDDEYCACYDDAKEILDFCENVLRMSVRPHAVWNEKKKFVPKEGWDA